MTSVELPIALPRPTSVRSRKREEVAPSQRSGLISWSRRLLWGGLLVAGVVVLVDQRHTVERAGALFVHIRWGWVGVAVALEACSILAMAQLGRCLLRVGGVRPPLRTMTEITLAGNALAVSIPGGPAVAAVWVFGQLRRHGADRTLATWVVLVSGALSSFALFVVATVGIGLAGGHGPAAELRPVALGLALIPVVVALLAVAARRWPDLVQPLRTLAARVPLGHVVGRAAGKLGSGIGAVRPTPTGWAMAFGLAVTNWLADCACLVVCFWALGIRVPWLGLLVAYGGVRAAASLPILPGSLGVVEGGLAFALVAYGSSMDAAIATVLLYRIVSFWGLVPVGWAAWGHLSMHRGTGPISSANVGPSADAKSHRDGARGPLRAVGIMTAANVSSLDDADSRRSPSQASSAGVALR